MTDRPILFSGPMVRALIEGRKTQTRRVLNPQPKAYRHCTTCGLGVGEWSVCEEADCGILGDEVLASDTRAPYAVGDHLWVRETWQSNGLNWGKKIRDMALGLGPLHYAATDSGGWKSYWGGWKPGIHMPRWASRLTLVVSEVRVERLQDISEADAIAEGSQEPSLRSLGGDLAQAARSERQVYQRLWDHLNAARGYGWDANPWVVALTFTVQHQNIDAPVAKEAA